MLLYKYCKGLEANSSVYGLAKIPECATTWAWNEKRMARI